MSDQGNGKTGLAAGRREFIAATAVSAALAAVGTLVTTGAAAEEAGARVARSLAQVRALVFDVFGTVVDWRSSIILDDLLVQFHIDGLSEEEIDHLNRAWHRL